MTDLFGQPLLTYYFYAPDWDYCVKVPDRRDEFDAIAFTADVLPRDAAPYENPECKTLTGKRIISLAEYKEMEATES